MTYEKLVKYLKKSGFDIVEELTATDADRIHMCLGLAGEVGELIDSIKKSAIYGKDIDFGNLIEELGDIEFYLEGLRQSLCITREEVLQHNIAKLKLRYPNLSYSDKDAIERKDKNDSLRTN